MNQPLPDQPVPDPRFELESFHASGAYGDVWRARQTPLNQRVAIKIIHPSLRDSFDVVEHAQAICRAGNHPHIVTVIDVPYVADPEPPHKPVRAVAMEWLDGSSLGGMLGGLLERRAAFAISRGILKGLKHIHDNGLTHNDLHLGNVIVVQSDHAKIIDIDYSSDRSLCLVSTLGKAERVKLDIRQAISLIVDVLGRVQDVPLHMIHGALLRGAQSIAAIEAALVVIENHNEQEPPAPPPPPPATPPLIDRVTIAVIDG